MSEAKNISVALGTVSGRIIFRNGDGPGLDTSIPFTIMIGDNCCVEHAKDAAEDIILKGAQRSFDEYEVVVSFDSEV